MNDVTTLMFPEPLLLLGLIRPIKPSRAAAAASGDVTAQEGTDWLEMLWTLAVSLVAPDDEEEGIHQLTETLTCKKTSHSFIRINRLVTNIFNATGALNEMPTSLSTSYLGPFFSPRTRIHD